MEQEVKIAREFHLGDILSISTGRLISPRGMGGVYDILNYMTGDDLFTHQLPRAAGECKPYLLDQMPWLAEIQLVDDFFGDEVEDWGVWLLCQVAERGAHHPVWTTPMDDHDVIDPINELRDMVGPDKPIIFIKV